MRSLIYLAPVAALLAVAAPASAQTNDRADASVIEQSTLSEFARGVTASSPRVAIAAPKTTSTTHIPVGAVVIDGASALRRAAFAPVIDRYVGRSLTDGDLEALAKAVADVARDRGYVFASASVPTQALSANVLRVRLDEGRIDRIRVRGDESGAVQRTLARLTDGRPVTRGELERALLIAGDLPGVRIRETRYVREGDAGVLLVDARAERVVGRVQLDNWGSSSVGPVRARLRADINEALFAGDQLTIRGTLTPLSPRELTTAGFDYSAATGLDGLVAGFGASHTRVRPGDDLRDQDYDGRSLSSNANLSYPFIRRLDANLWATIDFTVRDVEQDRNGELVRDDRFATVTLGLSGYRTLLGGTLYGRLSARQGLDILDATRAGDPLASRSNGSAIFSKLDLYADWTGPIAGPFGLRLAAEGQLASRPLLSSEEMGIGGPRFGRGYDYSERSGDRGIAGLAELRYDLKGLGLVRATQLFAYADAGHVDNLRSTGRSGSLYSAGFGARFDISRIFDAEVEAGFPIGKDRIESGDRSPRISFGISARF